MSLFLVFGFWCLTLLYSTHVSTSLVFLRLAASSTHGIGIALPSPSFLLDKPIDMGGAIVSIRKEEEEDEEGVGAGCSHMAHPTRPGLAPSKDEQSARKEGESE